ncbi:hypothetical protein L1887_14810 [Cichorium endivia]|nr:hypothetical protein L1887_14810 [Cichorium endivia]
MALIDETATLLEVGVPVSGVRRQAVTFINHPVRHLYKPPPTSSISVVSSTSLESKISIEMLMSINMGMILVLLMCRCSFYPGPDGYGARRVYPVFMHLLITLPLPHHHSPFYRKHRLMKKEMISGNLN